MQEQLSMNWTDERFELLRKLWSEGLSASQIAAQLGGVSRNAVIGKVHRLKLSSRGRAAAAPVRQKKTAHAGVDGRPRPTGAVRGRAAGAAGAAPDHERGGADLAQAAAHPAQRADLQ